MALEVELKLAVPVGDLPLLRACLPAPIREKSLRNIYYDSVDRALERGRRMLRLRMEEGSASVVLCFKGPSVHRDGVFRAEEVEWSLDLAQAAAFSADPRTQGERLEACLPGLSRHELCVLGEIHVQRSVFSLGRGLVLEMDHVRFSDGGEDAELEVEAPDERMEEARGLLGEVLRQAGVRGVDQEHTKYQRFLACAAGAAPDQSG